MKKILLIAVTLLLTHTAFAQWRALDFFATVPDITFTPQGTGYATSGYSILRSADGGATWNAVYQTPAEELIWAISFPEENTGYAAGLMGKIVKTTDAGNTWTVLSSGTTENLNCIFFVDANTGFAGGNGGIILKTTDGGATWTQKMTPNGDIYALYFRNADFGLAAPMAGPILQTQDGGVHWLPIVLSGVSKMSGISFPSDNVGYMCGWTDQLMPVIIKSTDGGNKWDILNVQAGHALRDIYFTSENTGYAVGLNCILKTTDGGATWGQQTVPLAQQFNCIYFKDENHGFIGGAAAIYVTDNGGGPIGVGEKKIPGISIAPNPATDFVNIGMQGVSGGIISLVSAKGQEVLRREVRFPAQLDLSGFAKGAYILNITAGGYVHTEKLILR